MSTTNRQSFLKGLASLPILTIGGVGVGILPDLDDTPKTPRDYELEIDYLLDGRGRARTMTFALQERPVVLDESGNANVGFESLVLAALPPGMTLTGATLVLVKGALGIPASHRRLPIPWPGPVCSNGGDVTIEFPSGGLVIS